MKYRSRTEIISMMLKAANGGATKTRIMYASYLSYAQVQEYIRLLLERTLVEYDGTTGLYTLTEKGIGFLRACEQVNEVIGLDDGGKVLSATAEFL